jgi:hypothetical protein
MNWFRSAHRNGKWHRTVQVHDGANIAHVLRGACGTMIGVDSTSSVPMRDEAPAETETCARCLRKGRT